MCVLNSPVKKAGRDLRVFLTRAGDLAPSVGELVGQKLCATSTFLQTVVTTVMSHTAPGWGTDLTEAAFSRSWSPGTPALPLTFGSDQRLKNFGVVQGRAPNLLTSAGWDSVGH